LNNGSAQTCGADQSACFVREYTQSASNIIVYMGCQNMFQCVKDFNNNSPSVADGRGTQPTVVGELEFLLFKIFENFTCSKFI